MIAVIEAESGAEYQLPADGGMIQSVAVSPDGRWVVAGTDDGPVRVWDLAAGAERPPLHGHRQMVKVVTFSPDGTRLASGSADGTGLVWDTTGWAGTVSAGRGLAALWAELIGPDAAAAQRGTFALPGAPDVVAFLAGTLDTPGDYPAAVSRVVAVLERVGSPAARTALERLAWVGADGPLARDASAALYRLGRGPAAPR